MMHFWIHLHVAIWMGYLYAYHVSIPPAVHPDTIVQSTPPALTSSYRLPLNGPDDVLRCTIKAMWSVCDQLYKLMSSERAGERNDEPYAHACKLSCGIISTHYQCLIHELMSQSPHACISACSWRKICRSITGGLSLSEEPE